jgi:two-component system LytT family sensor kinase
VRHVNKTGWRFKPWVLVSAVWLAPALFSIVNLVGQRRLHGEGPASLRDIIWSGGDWLIYAILTPPIFWVSRRWPIAKPAVPRRALLHILFALVFCVGWATSGKLIEVVLALAFDPDQSSIVKAARGVDSWSTAGIDWLSWILTTLPFGCVVYFSIAGIAHAIRYFTEARERELQLARLAEQLAGARFAALQAQVNPHFLFNTLNTIAVLVRDDNRAGAVRIVEQLSEMLRRTLSRDRPAEVRLKDELDVVRQYLAIEQVRFSDRLRPSWRIDAEVTGAAVPSFAVQHLVENAIRHGIARKEDAGLIEILARRDGSSLIVAVRDDGPGVTDATGRPGHGIANTRERLQALYGERASLELAAALGGGTIATLRVPFRELAPGTGRAD